MLRACTSPSLPSRSDFAPGSGDTINVAIDYSPLSLYRYGDTLGGFNYDLIRMVGSRLNRPLKFHPIVSLSKAIDKLSDGEYDIIVSATPLTASYKSKYRFTEPVYLDRQILISRDSTLQSQLHLAGCTLEIVAGSPVADRIFNLSREIGDTIYVNPNHDNGPEQLFILAASGKIRGAVIDERTARQMAPNFEGIDLSTAISFNQFQSWLMRPDSLSATADSIDKAIREIKLTAAYDSLLHRYNFR